MFSYENNDLQEEIYFYLFWLFFFLISVSVLIFSSSNNLRIFFNTSFSSLLTFKKLINFMIDMGSFFNHFVRCIKILCNNRVESPLRQIFKLHNCAIAAKTNCYISATMFSNNIRNELIKGE